MEKIGNHRFCSCGVVLSRNNFSSESARGCEKKARSFRCLRKKSPRSITSSHIGLTPRTPDFNVEPDIEYGVKLKRAFILQAVAPPSCPAINIEIRGCGGGGPSTSAHGGLFFRRHRYEVGCLLCSVMSCLGCVLCCLLCCALSTLCVLSALLYSVL